MMKMMFSEPSTIEVLGGMRMCSFVKKLIQYKKEGEAQGKKDSREELHQDTGDNGERKDDLERYGDLFSYGHKMIAIDMMGSMFFGESMCALFFMSDKSM